MIFSLEVLQADHGDSLLLHYGSAQTPKTIVIDGGPAGIYQASLQPRLLQIKSALSPNKPLRLPLVMVSHLDDDHVNGILDLLDGIIDKETDGEPQDFSLSRIWFNTFDDIIGNLQIPQLSSMAASASVANVAAIHPVLAKADHCITAVIASTVQGRQLRNNAHRLSLSINSPFQENKTKKITLVTGGVKESVVKIAKGPTITVIHPNQQRLEALQAKWDKDLQKARAKGDNSIIMASIGDKDDSPFNLSSIVCVVKYRKKTMLLTGDSRSDDILKGLKQAKLLKPNGKIHFNILKMPHHGSSANLSTEFLQTVTADHYVVSANGRHGNPDKDTLDALIEQVPKGSTLHFTNLNGQEGLKKKMESAIQKAKNIHPTIEFKFRDEQAYSMTLNLLDAIGF
jgi:beta-lactamase superfamily II metal-dependent hydrolase